MPKDAFKEFADLIDREACAFAFSQTSQEHANALMAKLNAEPAIRLKDPTAYAIETGILVRTENGLEPGPNWNASEQKD